MPVFNQALILMFRLQGALYGAYQHQTRSMLHLCNMPARTDVTRLSRQVAALTAELARVAARLEEEQDRRDEQSRRDGADSVRPAGRAGRR